MMIILKSAMRLLAIIALSAALVGCSSIPYYSTYENHNDVQWMNGKLRVVANTQHHVDSMFSFESHDRMTGQEWILATVSFPDQRTHRPEKREFLKVKGDEQHSFFLIEGSDFLIHETGGQCTLFDPQTGKDVSKPFPAAYLFNRSRTACLIVVDGKTVILDTLSALTGEPRVLARPPWGEALERLKFGRQTAHLTEDAQYLVLLPVVTAPNYIRTSNSIVEVLSTNGNKESWSIPLDQMSEIIGDAESIDGKVLLLSRGMLDNGAEDVVKLISLQGETLHSEKVPASSSTLWNPSANSILFPSYEFSPLHNRSDQTFCLWNYSSNTLKAATVWK